MRRRLTLPVLCAFLALAPAAHASGGESIASAPALAYGQLTVGGSLEQEFWRMQLYSGDRVAFTADLEGLRVLHHAFTLYSPSVSDYTLRDATAAAEAAPTSGKNEFFLKSPFTGLGTLDVCEGHIEAPKPCGQAAAAFVVNIWPQADPYSFTATVEHATGLTISAPAIARSGESITIRANLSSPAGTPQGNCLIQKRPTAVVAGHCSRRVRLSHGHKQTIHVAFLPDDGWQAASGHRTIHLAR